MRAYGKDLWKTLNHNIVRFQEKGNSIKILISKRISTHERNS